jgi:hypothetical protein
MDLVKQVFQNAYIIPHVKWYDFAPVASLLLGEDFSRLSEAKYSELRKVKKEVREKIETIRSQLENAQTVIPFTPSKKLHESVTDWKIEEKANLMADAGSLFEQGGYWSSYYNSESKNFTKMLLANANAMSIMLRGVLYDTPCKFCASIYNRVSGDCELFNTDEYYKQTCQPRITFASQLFEGDSFDLTEELHLSKGAMKDILTETSTGAMEV